MNLSILKYNFVSFYNRVWTAFECIASLGSRGNILDLRLGVVIFTFKIVKESQATQKEKQTEYCFMSCWGELPDSFEALGSYRSTKVDSSLVVDLT